jgi:hypothetical protein
MNMLNDWAARYGVTASALDELRVILGAPVGDPATPDASEANVQARERLSMQRRGGALWRNNVGVCPDNHVRYGLANDSAAINSVLKSSDLIGWQPVVIDASIIGTTIAQFVAIECKHGGWTRRVGDPHEDAQERWLAHVTTSGGEGRFSRGDGA